MDTTGPKVCAGVAMALSLVFMIYELTLVADSPALILPMMALAAAVFLSSLAALLLAMKKA
jgi:hypothetical protein